jgi:hypothetical protein
MRLEFVAMSVERHRHNLLADRFRILGIERQILATDHMN